jgi:Chaperone for flagella basal body P-ring formation
MKSSPRIRWAVKAGMTLAVSLALIAGLVAQERAAGESVVTERTDLATGARWMLMRDASNGGGPARWVLETAGMDKATGGMLKAVERKLLIHSGDKIVVEEQTAVLHARFEATALTSAKSNESLRARITIGGRVLSARAIAPGLAEIKEETR